MTRDQIRALADAIEACSDDNEVDKLLLACGDDELVNRAIDQFYIEVTEADMLGYGPYCKIDDPRRMYPNILRSLIGDPTKLRDTQDDNAEDLLSWLP